MNNILFIILILACSYIELSHKVNTDNVFEKLGVLSMVLGAGLELFNIHTHLITIGAVIYFCVLAYQACKSKHNRREHDKNHIST